ncbi:MAG TPA: VanW family protein [Polyangiales bacterium]
MPLDVRTRCSLARLQRGLAALCLLGSVAVAGAWLLPRREAHAASLVWVRIAGQPVGSGREPIESAERIARRYLDASIALHGVGLTVAATRASLGVKIDRDQLAALLFQVADDQSPLRRLAQTEGTRTLSLPMPAVFDSQAAGAFTARLKAAVDRAPIEPRIDPRTQRVLAGEDGIDLDVHGTLLRIANALVSGDRDVEAALARIPTRVVPSAWSRLDMRAVLGDFETRNDRADAHELQRAARAIDGYVLEPGAEFDFNEVVHGELSSRASSDRCQVASTLHAAVFFAGLPIVARSAQPRPSFYIKLGLDANVVEGAQTFRFENDRTYPIVIGVRAEDGHVYASLHGPVRDHSVQFIRHIDAVTPFEEHSVKDASLPGGLRVLAQRGVPGFKITRYRVVTDDVSHVTVRERTRDSYPPTAQRWRIGTGHEPSPDFERPRNDTHPEYVADEYLQMTQTESGTFDVARDSGRTGSYGWIAREGMLVRKE